MTPAEIAAREQLYDLLAGQSGVPARRRAVRLEKLAQDRALEARYQVCLSAGVGYDELAKVPTGIGITHPVPQLIARTVKLQDPLAQEVEENAFWGWDRLDPVDAAMDAWMGSPTHHANLVSSSTTTWGLGVYSELPFGLPEGIKRRWFFVNVFTRDLAMTVVVTTGENYPDGLAGGPYAAARGAPILLTRDSALPSATRAKLVQLAPSEIVVLGGSISPTVVAALGSYAPTVTWIKGSDRYATAALLA